MLFDNSFGGKGRGNSLAGLMSPPMDQQSLASLMAMQQGGPQQPRPGGAGGPQLPGPPQRAGGVAPPQPANLSALAPQMPQQGGGSDMMKQLMAMDPEKAKKMLGALGLGDLAGGGGLLASLFGNSNPSTMVMMPGGYLDSAGFGGVGGASGYKGGGR